VSISTTTVPGGSNSQENTSPAPAATEVSGKGRRKSAKGILLSTPIPEFDSDVIKVHLPSRRSKRKAMMKRTHPTTKRHRPQVQMGKDGPRGVSPARVSVSRNPSIEKLEANR
jgi:hypothetical protein